jgi:hypothetical protein
MIEVNTRYWCKECGQHFDGKLLVEEIHRHEKSAIRFIHDTCPHCGKNNNSPHVRAGSVTHGLERSLPFEHYIETVKLSMGDNHPLSLRLQQIQKMSPKVVDAIREASQVYPYA